MASDAVAEALRVACEWMHANCGEAESVEAWRYDAAGVIAAFLRALPGAVLPDHTGFNVVIPQSDLRAIAAAVERAAAREGRDG